MAVIGSKDSLNRDPAKMPRFNSSSVGAGVWVNNAFRNSGNASYFLTTNTLTALVTTDSVINTQRTIYSVSGKGGYLIYAFGGAAVNGAANLITTFVITVDGVATTVTLAPAEGSYLVRGFLGLPAGITLQQALNDNPASTALIAPQSSMDAGTSSAAVGNQDNMTVDYMGASGYRPFLLLPNVNQPFVNPAACLRFENSLTITVASDKANTDANQRDAGCLVRLDS